MSTAPVHDPDASVSSTAAKSARFYRPELDVLRFGAFILVFFCHAMPGMDGSTLGAHLWNSVKGGCGFGVSLFFLLSAYLITELLLRERESTGSIQIGAFYIRRALRIWPIYFLMLLATFFIGLGVHTFHVTVGALAAYSLLVGNWYTVLHGYLPVAAAPLWSIGVEEQFYIGWPTLVRFSRPRILAGVSIALWIVSQIAVFYLGLRHARLSDVVWANSLVHAQYFAVGALLSVALRGAVPGFKVHTRWMMVGGGLLLLFGAYSVLAFSGMEVTADGLHALSCFLLAGAGATLIFLGTIGAKIPSTLKPIVTLGKMSYGLYVFHSICLLVTERTAERLHLHGGLPAAVFVALPLTALVSYMSYRYFETPFLRLKERFTIIESRGV